MSPHRAGRPRVESGRALDPHGVARAFPLRWQSYLLAHFAGPAEVQRAFGVCEKTARTWWSGKAGARGSHVAVAVMRDGASAARVLFEADA